MKSVETQKVELLDEIVRSIKITQTVLEGTNIPLPEYASAILKKYEAIIPPAKFDQPIIEDVFDARICNLIRRELKVTALEDVYLKDVPRYSHMVNKRGFGKFSEYVYKETLKEYNFQHKL